MKYRANAGLGGCHVVLALALFATTISSAWGQTPPPATKTTRDASPIKVELPGLMGPRRELYQYTPDPKFWGTYYFFGQVPAAGAGDYPRVEVTLSKGNLGNWTESKIYDVARLKRLSFFKERQVTELEQKKFRSTDTRHFALFAVDNANCFAWDVVPDSLVERNRMGTLGGNASFLGYYCGPQGVTFTENDLQAILAAFQIALPPANTTVRLVEAMAPFSERLAALLRPGAAAPPRPAPQAAPTTK